MHHSLVFTFSPIGLALWCFLICYFMCFERFQLWISQLQRIWCKLLVLSWLYYKNYFKKTYPFSVLIFAGRKWWGQTGIEKFMTAMGQFGMFFLSGEVKVIWKWKKKSKYLQQMETCWCNLTANSEIEIKTDQNCTFTERNFYAS